MKRFTLLAVSLLVSIAAMGQDTFWRDNQGNPAPDTESRRSLNGLGGWLVVTSDSNWREKWDTPSDTVPHFNEAKTLARGEKVFVLAFFANPKLTADGQASIACDLDVKRPDGTSSLHQTDVVCFKGTIKGSPYNMYLSAPVVGFVGEPSDLAGVWTVRISLKDKIRGTVLPLRTSFTLK